MKVAYLRASSLSFTVLPPAFSFFFFCFLDTFGTSMSDTFWLDAFDTCMCLITTHPRLVWSQGPLWLSLCHVRILVPSCLLFLSFLLLSFIFSFLPSVFLCFLLASFFLVCLFPLLLPPFLPCFLSSFLPCFFPYSLLSFSFSFFPYVFLCFFFPSFFSLGCLFPLASLCVFFLPSLLLCLFPSSFYIFFNLFSFHS